MYNYYSESRKLERIFKTSNLKTQCRDSNYGTPCTTELVQKFRDAINPVSDSRDGTDATPGRYSAAAVAILRTELTFHAVKCIQLCRRARFPPSCIAVSDDNMEGSRTVVNHSNCIQATLVLRALTSIAINIKPTRIPLLKQLVDADIHSALSAVATELKPVLLQSNLHHPTATQAYNAFASTMMDATSSVYHVVKLCSPPDASASSRQLLSRFWVGSVQHKTPMAIMDLVNARQLPDVMNTAWYFASILLDHMSAVGAGYSELPEWSKALEALCRSHTVQQFGVQMLRGLLSSDHYSESMIDYYQMWMHYLTRVYEGGYEETHVLSDSLISSEGGALVEPLRQFAAGKLGSDWGWSTDLICPLFELYWLAWDQCVSARVGCSLEVLVSVSRQAGALLALRRLPLEQQKRGVRQARAAGIHLGIMQLEPRVFKPDNYNDANSSNDALQIMCYRGLHVSLGNPHASGRGEMPTLNVSIGVLLAAFEVCLRNAQEHCLAYLQIVNDCMRKFLMVNKEQLQRPSDCAVGFLTSLRKVMAPDLVDSSNMPDVQRAVLLMASGAGFADNSPAPGPGILSAILLQFLPLFTRCATDLIRCCNPMTTWCLLQRAINGDPRACCEIAAACNAAKVLNVLMSNPVHTRRLLTNTLASNDGGVVQIAYQHFFRDDSNQFMLGIQKAWDYQVLMVADPLTRLLDQAPGELRPRALLLAVCGVESLTRGNASLELPSKIALHEGAVRLVARLSVCGNDISDVYPRAQTLVRQLMSDVRALQLVVPPSLESLRIKAPIPGCYNPRCINLSGVSESLMECKMCSGCNKAQFCSVACQRQHWPAHRKACRKAGSQ